MKSLKTHKANGYTATLIEDRFPLSIYECTKEGAPPHYEVVKFRPLEKERTLPNGTIIPVGHISYPGNEQWGTYGWTFNTMEQAEQKLSKLLMTPED